MKFTSDDSWLLLYNGVVFVGCVWSGFPSEYKTAYSDSICYKYIAHSDSVCYYEGTVSLYLDSGTYHTINNNGS